MAERIIYKSDVDKSYLECNLPTQLEESIQAYLTRENTNLTAQEQKILAYTEKNGQIRETDIMELLDVKKTRAYTLARNMCDKHLLTSTGRGVEKKYRTTTQ